MYGRANGHFGRLQVDRAGGVLQQACEQSFYFLADLLLDERREVFFSAERWLAASGSGRASHRAWLTSISSSLRARNLLYASTSRWNLLSRLPARNCTVLVLPATLVVKA
jgi:hypothetical protein